VDVIDNNDESQIFQGQYQQEIASQKQLKL